MTPLYHPRPERCFQFSLRFVLFWVIPYVALLAWIWSWPDEPPPDEHPLDFLRIAAFGHAIRNALREGMRENLTIALTALWLPALLISAHLKERRTKRAEKQ